MWRQFPLRYRDPSRAALRNCWLQAPIMRPISVSLLAAVSAFACLLSLSACIAADLVPVVGIPFVNIDRGTRSGIREQKLVVSRRAADWRDLWIAHRSGAVTPQDPPIVDFEKEMVLAIFLGEKLTGGYRSEIVSVGEDRASGQLRVVWRQFKPPAGAITTQALTQPFHIVKVQKNDLPLTFVMEP